MFEIGLRIVAVGAVATLVMDLWGLMLRRVYGVAGLDYRLLGRWLAHMLRGQVRHDGIARAAPVRAELAIGWAAHYAIGVVFAGGLVACTGAGWLNSPTILPALLAGLITVSAPFLILQPAFGLGFAASRTPNPSVARLRSLVTHLVFGAGLYAAARISAVLFSISQT